MTGLIQNYHQTLKLSHNSQLVCAKLCFTFATLQELQKHVQKFLHQEELQYWHKLQFEKRKASYLLGRYAAKEALQAFYGPTLSPSTILIKHGIFSHPVICYWSKDRLQLSLSHCNSIGAALLFPETHPMGIDLETISENHNRTIKTILTVNEKQLIDTFANRNNPFLHVILWTVKEALSKILRTGITVPLTIFEIKDVIPHNNYWSCNFVNFTQYKAISFCLGDNICSVVYPKNTKLHINIPLIQKWGQNKL